MIWQCALLDEVEITEQDLWPCSKKDNLPPKPKRALLLVPKEVRDEVQPLPDPKVCAAVQSRYLVRLMRCGNTEAMNAITQFKISATIVYRLRGRSAEYYTAFGGQAQQAMLEELRSILLRRYKEVRILYSKLAGLPIFSAKCAEWKVRAIFEVSGASPKPS